jgi:hypothetical protein
MEYHGKLYGKFGNKHFDTGKTSEDFDKLERDNLKMLEMLAKISKGFNDDEKHLIVSKARELIKQSTEI